METLPPVEQRLVTLQPYRSIQDGAVRDAGRLFPLVGGDDRFAGGEQTAHVIGGGGPPIMKHVRFSSACADIST